MFKKRSLLSFRRPKSVIIEGSPKPGKVLVLSTSPLSSSPTTSAEKRKSDSKNHNRLSTEPLFHDEFITPTAKTYAIDDQFVDYVSARNPEVDQFIDGLKADTDLLPAKDLATIAEEDYEEDYDPFEVECVTIDDVGISYPSGSAKVIDHDPWSFPAVSRSPRHDIEHTIPALSPYRRLASAGSDSSSSSAACTIPSTPASIGWPLPDPTSGKAWQHVEAAVVVV